MVNKDGTNVQADDARAERGKAIALIPGAVKEIKSGLFTVQSQSGVGTYRVENNRGWKCNCPDFITRGVECKHIIAVQYHLKEKRGAPDAVPSKKERVTIGQDWSAYNTAQIEEVRLFDSLLSELVEGIEEPEHIMGRPRLPLNEQLFCAVQKVYSQLSSRRASGLYKNANERGQIDHAPHFNAPSKLFNRGDITPILHELVMLSALPVVDMETDFAVDSTGFRTTTFNAFNGEKHGVRKKHNWLKAHLCTGVSTNIVTSVVITDANGSDSGQFETLVKKTADGFLIHEVSADMAYSSRPNLDLIEELGGTAFIPFKSNAIAKAKGSAAWNRMYHYFQMNREEFMEHYHKRSNVEATNAAIKRKFGETLKSKNPTAQTNELLAKIVAYNITVIIHEMYENGVEPDFLHLKSLSCTQIMGAEVV
ncbi:MAG: transposase [Methanomassiliicoccales archaeon]|nr:transposase [Methanomassiliicoccales archaeon]